MSVYTSKKTESMGIENEYTAQITPFNGKVNVEILCAHESTFDRQIKLWIAVMNKSFGRTFASEPREKDYIAATKWMNNQMELLHKYGTNVITEPQFLIDKKLYGKGG